jgi:nickel-dependent lactate racemase
MIIPIPYGKTHLELRLPDTLDVTVLTPHKTPPVADPERSVRHVLDSVNWAQFAGATSAAIAINDKTRPVPHALLLPPLLERIEALGIARERIVLIIATGNHAPMTPDEFPGILPAEVIERYKVISHDVDARENLVTLGTTPRGTPVTINRAYLDADLRLVVGNVEPHQFIGFSGGVKSAVIGLAGMETINANHRMMTEQNATLGRYDDNPARQDVEDLGRMVGIHLALNTVLNDHKEIVRVFCGQPLDVMRAAIPLVRQVYEIPIPKPFDLMIISPGGYPKDINIYQAQKALGHASLVTRPDGAIIVAAACSEGSGSSKYENWVRYVDSQPAVVARFRQEGFRVGPHKAYQIARDSVGRRVIWVTELPDPDFFLMESARDLSEAVERVFKERSEQIKHIGVMPYANATIPALIPELNGVSTS